MRVQSPGAVCCRARLQIVFGLYILVAPLKARASLIAQICSLIVLSSTLCYLIEALNGPLSTTTANNSRPLQWLRYAQVR